MTTNNHNLPQRVWAEIEALTPEQLIAIRANISSPEYDDTETRLAVQQYVADGGQIADLMDRITLTGYDAIDYAEAHGLTLCKYNDPIEDARAGLTVGEAKKIASEDPGLIYIERGSK